MIPHRLNLLSPQKRKHLKRMVNFQFAKSLLELMLIFLSCAGIALLGGQWVLQNHFNEITGHIVSVTNKYAEKNLEIKKINVTLTRTEKIQKNYTLWTEKIVEITEQIPEGIVFTNLNFNSEASAINMSGTANTRDDLLNLKNNLEAITWLKNVQIPPDQLTQKENIQFSITPSVK
jgi:Tfp pilus assembly protein PilN